MTNRELFRALGEIREDLILEAEEPAIKKAPRRRRYMAIAACLALLLGTGLALDRTGAWAELTRHFPPSLSTGTDAGDCTAAGDVDGSDYSSPGDAPAEPNYSVNVEIGELSTTSPGAAGEREYSPTSPRITWSGPEEILAMDTVIFRGTVENLRCFVIESGSYKAYYTIASVKITGCIRGDLAVGDIYNILYTGLPGEGTNVSGDLKNLVVGSDAIFMPFWTNPEAGWITEEGFFAYQDLAELYFDVGPGLLFLDTGNGLSFDREVYGEISDAETLDQVAAYLRTMIGEVEQDQPAANPAEPDPGEADPAQPDPAYGAEGPAGDREETGTPATPSSEPSRTVNAGEYRTVPLGPELPGGAHIGGK